MQTSFKASVGYMPTLATCQPYKHFLYIKKSTINSMIKNSTDKTWWSKRSFFRKKTPFQKTGSHFYDHVMNHIPFKLESHENKMILENFHRIKELWLFFWRGAVKNSKIKTILSFWTPLTKASFIACFKDWHHQNQNFMVSKMVVSRFL